MGCKRQKLGDSNCLSKTFESVQVEYIGVLKRIRDEIQVIENLSISGDTVVTVSYTHLDVYKRQPTNWSKFRGRRCFYL